MLLSRLAFIALGLGPVDAQLGWEGDGVCPGAAVELEHALAHELGEATAPEHVEATLSLRDQGPAGIWLQLRIASQFGREQHELAAIDCDQLIDEAALLIAGVMDPFATVAAATAPSWAERHHEVVVQSPTREAIAVDSGAHVEPPASEP